MTALRVLAPGLFTLVVDLGRPRWRSLGVPVGGAADSFSLALGNALVGNPPGAAALEVTLSGPTLHLPEGAGPLACVLFGAPFEIISDRQGVRVGVTFTFQGGETISIGGTRREARGYFCVRGGFQTQFILESRSGLAPLRGGEELPCLPGRIGGRSVRLAGEEEGPVVLRVLPGGQAGWFGGETPVADAPGSPLLFAVTSASNRMGLRLLGPPLSMPDREIASEPVCPGTVQVTRDGQCIVLGVDGQTIGGYPKVAQVIRADLDRLGQLRPGQQVCFQQVSPAEAQLLDSRRRRSLEEWRLRLLCAEAGE